TQRSAACRRRPGRRRARGCGAAGRPGPDARGRVTRLKPSALPSGGGRDNARRSQDPVTIGADDDQEGSAMAATPRRGARSARARRRADAARGTQEQTPEAAAVARPEDRARAADAAARTDGAATGSGRFDRLSQHPAVRVGAYAWATLGIIGLLVVAGV